MSWWSANIQWFMAVIVGALASGLGVWTLRLLFKGSRGASQHFRFEDETSPKSKASKRASAAVVRRHRRAGWTRRQDVDDPRRGARAGSALKLGLGVVTGALIVTGAIFVIAFVKDVPVTALPASLIIALAGPAATLGVVIIGVYLLGRRAMQRHAKRLGIDTGSGVSCYKKALNLFLDPTEALSHSRAAILALKQGATLDEDSSEHDQVVGWTATSGQSFGEIIHVRVRRTMMERAAIQIQSQPVIWQLFDGGINAENVASIARFLEEQASSVGKPRPASTSAPAPEASTFMIRDWLALAYLAVLACFTSFIIALKALWPNSYSDWVTWLDSVPLDPLRLLGHTCAAGDPSASAPIVLQLNVLIFPTLVAYSAYNTIEFHTQRDRMDALNWLLCISSLIFLPLLVLTGCSPDWIDGASAKNQGLATFVLTTSAGGAVYALLLAIFCNGASYLPALFLARIIATKPEDPAP